jgi:anti-sigma regulatory factor (Ser/Thr protein kinase)
MKTIAISSPLIVSDQMEGSIMGMDAAGMNTATYFMRDKIYSDKIKAVVREYVCNAIDEHSKHNISSDVKISLLKDEDHSYRFAVRDFGKGLSESDVRNVFGMYFRSTKSKSNDSIGGFGIGSKAGHCYSDTFFVTSHFNGTKSTYTCMLGGGDTGVPIGHIYKIDECPTSESGIEISLKVENHDHNRFDKEILSFVRFSTANIIYIGEFNSEPARPEKTVYQLKISNYNFRLIEHDANYCSLNKNLVYLQMGGVVYDTVKLNYNGPLIKDGHNLVVDIPIGMMSIPISRESFEDTVSNNKIINEIESLITSLSEKDMEPFKDKTLIDLVKDRSSIDFQQYYVGDIFCCRASYLYSDIWSLAVEISTSNAKEKSVKFENSKPVLLIIPNNSAASYWLNKLKQHCIEKDENYYIINERHYRKNGTLIDESFDSKEVKKIKFDKVAKQNSSFGVWSNYSKLGCFSAMNFNNFIRKCDNKDAISCEEQAKKENLEFTDSIDKLDDLLKITICNSRFYPKNRHMSSYYCSSVQLVEALKEIGWIEYGSDEYHKIYNKISKKNSEIQNKQMKIRSATRNWATLNQKTISNISSNVKYATKVSDFWKKVLHEDSTRGKVLKAIDDSNQYRNAVVLSRQQIRNILKLK